MSVHITVLKPPWKILNLLLINTQGFSYARLFALSLLVLYNRHPLFTNIIIYIKVQWVYF